MTWGDDLRAVRQIVGLSREALARLAGVSAATVKSYEDGSRNPSRQMLVALLDAMRVERHARNTILIGAGFAPDGEFLGPVRLPGYMYTPMEAEMHIAELPWPAFVFNELFEVVCANELTQRIWGVDLERDFPPGIARNLLFLGSTPRIAELFKGWDNVARTAIAVIKSNHPGPDDLQSLGPYFADVMQLMSQGGPGYVARFLELWDDTLPNDPKVRLTFPAVFKLPEVGKLSFHCLVTTCSESEGLSFNDWIPIDAETWRGLEILRTRGS
ncbi:MAG: helix-turn-helix domain-containing protein [Chloroflexota bacterium]